MDRQLFSPVDDENARHEVIDALGAGHATLELEGESLRLAVHVARLEPNGELLVHLPETMSWPYPADERLSVRFEMGGRTYFFKSTPRIVAGGAYLPTEGAELFRAQPRKQFRMVIPEAYAASYELTSRNSAKASFRARVLDVSPDGFGLRVPAHMGVAVGDQLSGILHLGKRPPLEIAGVVRFTRGDAMMQVGLEIEHTVHQSEDRMNEALLFLRHDLFYLKKND